MSANRGSGSGVGGAVRQHRQNDLLVLVGRLETVLQRRPLEIALVVKWMFAQPRHHPLDRRVPVRRELGVAPPPVVQRLERYVSGGRRRLPSAPRNKAFPPLALII